MNTQLENYVRSNNIFRKACESTFAAADFSSKGKIPYSACISCVDQLFSHLKASLMDYGEASCDYYPQCSTVH